MSYFLPCCINFMDHLLIVTCSMPKTMPILSFLFVLVYLRDEVQAYPQLKPQIVKFVLLVV